MGFLIVCAMGTICLMLRSYCSELQKNTCLNSSFVKLTFSSEAEVGLSENPSNLESLLGGVGGGRQVNAS